MKAFKAPHDSIGTLDAETAATLIATAADVAIVVDGAGIIQDLAFQRADLSLELEGYGKWFGRHWSETVTADSQHKVEALIREAGANNASGWRQINHQTAQGRDVPILYSAVRLGSSDRFVALGRDLRAVATLQQRLIDAQMAMERDYARLRFAETRYRVLFQTASEPVLIVDAATLKVVEANPAATTLIDRGSKRGIGRPFVEMFAPTSRSDIQTFLSELRSGNRADDMRAELAGTTRSVTISASAFRQEAASLLLVRLLPVTSAHTSLGADDETRFSSFIQAAPDGFVLTNTTGRILAANAAFADMVQVSDADQLHGTPIERWFRRQGVDFDVLTANLRQHGSVRLFATTLNGDEGASIDVEISAVTLGQDKAKSFGFAIRNVGLRLSTPPARAPQDLPHSAAQLTELIGRVPLKDLVRETTDVIEKLCIEAALELTGDNRASAAEMLGLSRQSLYVKLRRFGFADVATEDESQA
ncbi:transcriptional regulator PpsR [Beijerinckia sp. L45]|uniref:transcriptional regulator PpsR n=1 Tax=Beijerinckia sp. L45 TaxID=1641855 RepID=UPI00131DB9FD|nr:transcriptional regulator PpsR [Beijerinckia sp. L45]